MEGSSGRVAIATLHTSSFNQLSPIFNAAEAV
ncbi:hypothetical protein NIES21_59530 (plasmid) [Anabaenopsis circularis NIES-21]|uniref:Uncharacterized protein n=1 Tax=Anabaenopsis circularis NIES-21 TaxID=1085406 RepID=A0A1Z4GRG6_9CYAN|nr:hypothetical protein NIES21_59530 [Anabaenopsis circularis NIES-21]